MLFLIMWLYTEVEEQKARTEWQAFVRTGERFTAEDGARLEARIEALEGICEADPAGCR
jgi:hypothetical protein